MHRSVGFNRRPFIELCFRSPGLTVIAEQLESHTPPADSTLGEIVSGWARSSSNRRLAIYAGAGTVIATAAYLLQPPGWFVIACIATCAASYGAWGIADRELIERPLPRTGAVTRLLQVSRVVTAIIAIAAVLILARRVLGVVLGRFIS